MSQGKSKIKSQSLFLLFDLVDADFCKEAAKQKLDINVEFEKTFQDQTRHCKKSTHSYTDKIQKRKWIYKFMMFSKYGHVYIWIYFII